MPDTNNAAGISNSGDRGHSYLERPIGQNPCPDWGVDAAKSSSTNTVVAADALLWGVAATGSGSTNTVIQCLLWHAKVNRQRFRGLVPLGGDELREGGGAVGLGEVGD